MAATVATQPTMLKAIGRIGTVDAHAAESSITTEARKLPSF